MQVLQQLPQFAHPDLLVGQGTMDDAGVFRIDAEQALVLTVDVLTPIADDPWIFGQIAAANSLSDVYAMGGKPVAALSVLGFPVAEIEHRTIRAILAGAWDKVREADTVIVGGHTFKDFEVKFGLAVVGLVHPEKFVANSRAKPGDVLVLTKPLGIGVVTTALKANRAEPATVAEANRVMVELNRVAAAAMVRVGVDAATDITGFGLLGHAWEMAQASGVELVIEWGKVPFLPGARELAKAGLFPGGTVKNYEFVQSRVEFSAEVDKETKFLLCDAQTSGGLLIAVPEGRVEELLKQIERGWVVGYVREGLGRVVVI